MPVHGITIYVESGQLHYTSETQILCSLELGDHPFSKPVVVPGSRGTIESLVIECALRDFLNPFSSLKTIDDANLHINLLLDVLTKSHDQVVALIRETTALQSFWSLLVLLFDHGPLVLSLGSAYKMDSPLAPVSLGPRSHFYQQWGGILAECTDIGMLCSP